MVEVSGNSGELPEEAASELSDGLGMYTEPQVLDMYHEWNVRLDGKISGIRFGQWCCNNYPDLHRSQWLWNESDNKKVLQTMILAARGCSA